MHSSMLNVHSPDNIDQAIKETYMGREDIVNDDGCLN